MMVMIVVLIQVAINILIKKKPEMKTNKIDIKNDFDKIRVIFSSNYI